MSKPGTYVALFMLLLAMIATAGNVWYQRHRAAQPLALWGTEPARLIGLAPKVEALRLTALGLDEDTAGSDTVDFDTVDFAGSRLRVAEVKDASESRGMKNIRQGLIDGASFDWNATRGDCDPQWEYALRFRDGTSTATVLFALNCGRVALAGSAAEGSVAPTAEAYEGFLREQFPNAPSVLPDEEK